ncbi:MAG: hypothetical protein HUU35_15765, partial [Armatimonadetes bacterium]|nr:hypothetical protein [Armatimonadota bacterium]
PLEIAPLPKVEGLPAARPPMTHHAGRVVVDDIYFRLGRIGQWGDFVADPEASDGYAAKLYNSHYEWCLTWPIRPELFEPGARYTARARLKVEHQGREGEAFWAGVYDTARKKGWGEARATTAKVKPGYQWYDLATWTPEGQQYVWVGPGVFDLKGGAKSAIEALYVDQFEFVKVP